MASFSQVSPPKSCMPLASIPYCYMPGPSHFFRFDQRNTIGEYRSLSSPFCRLLHSPVTSSLLGSIILLSTLFSNTLSLRSSLNVSDQVSHPYKTRDKIIFPYILIFVFLESNF